MISVKEALEIALSEDLSRDELKYYNIITDHIDQCIRNKFNGKSVDIYIEGTVLGSSSNFKLSNYIYKEWRRNIIMNKWKSEYSKNGWLIETYLTSSKDPYYVFKIDPSYKRDEKLELLLKS